MTETAREIIESYRGRPLRIMEVCGTHTHEIFRLGIRKILPEKITLISGPGCPVCVTRMPLSSSFVLTISRAWISMSLACP